jgi:hypothetical protein
MTRFKQTRQSNPLVSITRDIPSIREACMRIPGFRYEDRFTSTSGLSYCDLIHDERTTLAGGRGCVKVGMCVDADNVQC